jgi:hypothetical protein
MKQIKYIFFILCCLIITGCDKNEQKIKTKIIDFHKKYSFDYKSINEDFLSIELQESILKMKVKETLDDDISKTQRNSEIKPFNINKDFFIIKTTSFDSIDITSIKMENDTAFVNVCYYVNNKKCQNYIEMTNENGWKINNVFFDGENKKGKNTQAIIKKYLN